MEKTIQLDQRELAAAAPIEQQCNNGWAQVGMLMEQLELARRNRDTALERQRAWVNQTAAAHGIERFQQWRLAPGVIIVTLEDAVEAEPAEPAEPPEPPKANGALQPEVNR